MAIVAGIDLDHENHLREDGGWCRDSSRSGTQVPLLTMQNSAVKRGSFAGKDQRETGNRGKGVASIGTSGMRG